jgi:hypothetical protein
MARGIQSELSQVSENGILSAYVSPFGSSK